MRPLGEGAAGAAAGSWLVSLSHRGQHQAGWLEPNSLSLICDANGWQWLGARAHVPSQGPSFYSERSLGREGGGASPGSLEGFFQVG